MAANRSNNPFARTQPTVLESAASRYPEVEAPYPAQQAYQQNQYLAPSYQPQQQQSPEPNYQQQQQQYQPQQQQHLQGFQPQTAFGQGIAAQVTGQQQAYGGGIYSGGGQQQQSYMPQASPNVLDLDPYSHLNSPSSSSAPQAQPSVPSISSIPTGQHPKQYVQEARVGLSNFEDYSWKQLFSRIDSLRESWEARRQMILDARSKGADMGSVDRLSKAAASHIDSIHAAKLQLSEVKSGWMQSSDVASKARVREALNAGITSLPDFPPQLAPEELGGAYIQRAQDDYRKQSILSGFQQQPSYSPQYQYPQQTGYMQPQQTGYVPQQQQQQQQQQYQQQQPPNQYFQGGGQGQGPYYG